MNMLLRGALIVSLVPALIQPSALSAESLDWKAQSRIAYELYRHQQYQQALHKYSDCLQYPGPNSEKTEAGIDLRLNMVQILCDLNQLDQAANILSNLTPAIKQYRGGLLELRFWRRKRQLYLAEKATKLAALAQKRICDLNGKIFGTLSEHYISTRNTLLFDLIQSQQWPAAFEIVRTYAALLKEYPDTTLKHHLAYGLQMFRNGITNHLSDDIKAHNAEDAYSCADMLTTVDTDMAARTYLWSLVLPLAGLLQKGQRDRPASEIISGVEQLGKAAPRRSVEVYANLLLAEAFTRVYAGNFDEHTEELLSRAWKSLELKITPSEGNRMVLYIHTGSLLALVLAKRGNIQKATAQLKDLSPCSVQFHDHHILDGLTHARVAIAEALVQQGKLVEAHQQFQALRKQLASMPKVKDKGQALTDWKWKEEQLLPTPH